MFDPDCVPDHNIRISIIYQFQSDLTTPFYAPYTNYYTTFSTTVVTLLEKLGIISSSSVIRIEEIYLASQDSFTNPALVPVSFTNPEPLIYKSYPNLTDYKNALLLNLSQIKNETLFFNPVRNHPHLLESISKLFPSSIIIPKYQPISIRLQGQFVYIFV